MLGRFNFAHRNQSGTELANGVGDKLSCFGLALCFDDCSLHLLLTLLDNVLSAFCLLLSDLLRLNSRCEISGELKISDGDVIKNDSELVSTGSQHLSNLQRDLLSLGDQLLCVILSDNRLEHFVTD